MKKIKSPRDYALYLLGRREYSVFEIREKLEKKFPEEISNVEKLIQNFVQKNWLSDKRFVEVFIRDQKIKKIGPLKIVEKLWRKGISKSFAQEVIDLSYLRSEQVCVIKYLRDKKFKLLASKNLRKSEVISDFELKNKVINYIVGRGFSFDLIQEFFDKEDNNS